MRVQPFEHAAHGILEQRAVIDLIDVGALDALEDLGEGAQLIQRQVRALAGILSAVGR